MRVSPIKNLLTQRGAVFREICGREIACSYSSFSDEYNTVREAVGLTDFSFAVKYRVTEESLDVFEKYAAGSVADIRFGRILHTMAVDEEGMLESELYIANDDDKFILLGESLVSDESVKKILLEQLEDNSVLEDLSENHALFGLDGLNAWATARDLFGPDVLGLPYMSVETYDLEGIEVKLFRAGKTSEFGYLLMVDAASAEKLWLKIEAAGEKWGLKPVGFDAHMALRLDGRFFNIHKEGAAVRDPLPLGLQWMMDLEGDDYRGKAALMSRREKGLSSKIVGATALDNQLRLNSGDKLLHQGTAVASVVAAEFSPVLNTTICLALFDAEFAYSGLTFETEKGGVVKTVSMPPFTAKSLTVRLDEM